MRIFGSLILTGLAVLSGCVDENSSIYISHVGLFTYEAEEGCSVTEDAYLTRATFNVAFAENSYVLPAIVVSQLVRRDVSTSAETNGVHIHGAEVQILNEAGAAITPEYSVVASGGVYIPPSAVGDSASRAISFNVIPAPVTAILQDLVRSEGAQTIVVNMRVFGRTTGGTDVESGYFRFGVELVDDPDDVLCDSAVVREEFPLVNCVSGQDGVPYLARCI